AALYAAGPGGVFGGADRAALRPLALTAAAASAPALVIVLLPAAEGRVGAALAVWMAWLAGTAAAALTSATGRVGIAVAIERLRLRRGSAR
ncbi:hypothetical protein, partial [Elioraea sp.]|uniref:hypothetical protein n=1 Tax=Elioraea sp. TaxID=2185103 RepID=UPI003F722CBC